MNFTFPKVTFRLLSSIAVIVSLLLLMTITVSAATLNSFSISIVTATAACNTSVFNVTWNFTAVDINTGGGDQVGVIVTDGAGVAISTDWQGFVIGTTGSRSNNFGPGDIINAITTRPLTLQIYDLTSSPPGGSDTQAIYDNIVAQGAPLLAQTTYDPANDVADCASLPYIGGTTSSTAPDSAPQQVFFDERINDFDTGNSVVLYGKANSDDEWRLEVYNADASGMLLVIYPETIAAVPECPDSNTLIYSDAATGISLYRLPEQRVTAEGVRICPFQLNAPATEAGKTYIIIFDTLYPSTYYQSWDEWLGQ